MDSVTSSEPLRKPAYQNDHTLWREGRCTIRCREAFAGFMLQKIPDEKEKLEAPKGRVFITNKGELNSFCLVRLKTDIINRVVTSLGMLVD